jgi:hypothetical protein
MVARIIELLLMGAALVSCGPAPILDLPADALPTSASAGGVAWVSRSYGLFERTGDDIRLASLPNQILGEARYGPDALWIHLPNCCVVRWAGRDERPGSSPFRPAAVRGALKTGDQLEQIDVPPPLLRILPRRNGQLWIATTPTPTTKGEILSWQSGQVRSISSASGAAATIADWIDTGDRVLAATPAGVIDVETRRLLTTVPATAIAWDEERSIAWAGGSGLWRIAASHSTRAPLYWRTEHGEKVPAGQVLDIAVAASGCVHVLLRGGRLLTLDPSGEPLEQRGDLSPATTHLIADPTSGALYVGGGGPAKIPAPARCRERLFFVGG